MILKQKAVAGTSEGSDVTVMAEPLPDGIELEIDSIVKAVFGEAIEKTVLEVLDRFDITACKISLKDYGALDCTIRARVETALDRACKEVKV
ncbi:MAG: citrate lyase acyl carrier protein [Clostridia bacterium]|nr:citrate lyase acyl carrier protein [Clostridia bacterium]